LILENVPFMLKLDKGHAISRIVSALERMGWAWAYRTIDSRAFGLPHRRRRVILVASRERDPRPVLFNSDAGEPNEIARGNHACGFYWTEGNTGLGWAIDAIPPLKGGSGLHIPSPPAIWFPRRRCIVVPSIEDAERLQGFPAGWTEPAADEIADHRRRWHLVGNAVSVPLAEWLAKRLRTDSGYRSNSDKKLKKGQPWPDGIREATRSR
jgi:DNA (cytosine-5)-methyltransferase 1